jgi:hypothetical protein
MAGAVEKNKSYSKSSMSYQGHKGGRFFQILWPSQNMYLNFNVLMQFLYRKLKAVKFGLFEKYTKFDVKVEKI